MKKKLRLGVFAASLASSLFVHAQTAPSASADELVRLDPFRVNAAEDHGYVAGNAISATRVSTGILDLPFTISAFTPQFIADTGAVSLLEIVGNSAGVKSAINSNVQGNANFSVRGFLQPPQRDGYSPAPLANNFVGTSLIERVEVVKGPASLLYGTIAPGGTVNYITKSPEERTFSDVHLSIGSYNFAAATLDTNDPLIPKKLLFRLVATYENAERYFQNVGGHTTVLYPVLKWTLTPNVTLTTSFQYYFNRESPPAVYLPNTNLATPASIVAALYNPGHPAGSALLVNKTGPAVALGVSDVSDPGFMGPYPGMPNNFNISGIHDYRLNSQRAYNAELHIKLSDRWIGRAHVGVDTDKMTFLETGHATLFLPPPDSLVYTNNVWSIAPSWTAMTSAQQIASSLDYAQRAVRDLSLLESTQNGTPTPALIDRAPRVQEQWLDATTMQWEAIGNYNFPGARLQVLGGLFYDAVRFNLRTTQNRGNAASPFFRDWDVNPHSPTYFVNYDEGQFNGNNLTVVNAWSTTKFSDKAAYALASASLFQNRLSIVGGARYNFSQSRVYDHVAASFSQGLHTTHTAPQLGIGYKVFPDVMLYTSYSESYTLSTQPYLTKAGTVNGLPSAIPTTATSPTIGKGTEAGIKMGLLDNTLQATLSVYEIKVSDVLQALNTNIQGIGVVVWSQGAKQRARGVEGTFSWAPTKNWQIVTSVSEEDVRNVQEPVGLDYYLGQITGYTAKTTANLWTRYNVTNDAFRGLWVGGGVNYVGRNAGDPRNKDYFLPAYTLYNTAVGLDWKWNDKPMTAVFNFKNMGNAAYKASPNSIGEPRRMLLSLTMRY